MPLVSICIPTYNGERYLRDALQSALDQTFTDCEILLVDDGSTDRTLDIAQEILHPHTNARIYENDRNLGLVGNWNRCVELAEGEYIKFLFQDDVLYPDCVEKLAEAVKCTSGFAFCRRRFLIEDDADPQVAKFFSVPIKSFQEYQPAGGSIGPQEFGKAVLDSEFKFNLVGEPSSVLFRKSSWERLGPFSANLSQFVDWEYWMRIGTNDGASFAPETLNDFRVHGGSTTTKNRSKDEVLFPADMITILHTVATSPHYAAFRKLPRAGTLGNRLLCYFEAMLTGTGPGDWNPEFKRTLDENPDLARRISRDLASPKLLKLRFGAARLRDRLAILRGKRGPG